MKIQYPMESAKVLADYLIQHRLIEAAAWYDSEAYDNSVTLNRIHQMQEAVARTVESSNKNESDLLDMIYRCEAWFSTLPEGRKMQLECQRVITESVNPKP